ncbi:MAG TPA: DUF6168 family protein [Flavobacteriaceae bacterium]|nr:DUF6168 family protein [Flavobacteriaceae bacterium]
MNQSLTRFTAFVVMVLAAVFAAHMLILKAQNLPLFDNKIIVAYLLNALLAIIIFATLYTLKNKYQTQLGFLFLFGSALKFVVFFVVFYPVYKADGVMDKLEFAAFFIPYAISLILETVFLSKMLNSLK